MRCYTALVSGRLSPGDCTTVWWYSEAALGNAAWFASCFDEADARHPSRPMICRVLIGTAIQRTCAVSLIGFLLDVLSDEMTIANLDRHRAGLRCLSIEENNIPK